MKEEILLALIKELSAFNKLHKEYHTEDISYIVDSNREGNVLHFDVKIQENKDKKERKEFEKWVDQLDDDIFNEVWESLSMEDNLHNLSEIYKTQDYKKVIDKFKAKTKEVASIKIKELEKLLS